MQTVNLNQILKQMYQISGNLNYPLAYSVCPFIITVVHVAGLYVPAE